MKTPAIVWFRQDLRVEDNPALVAAAAAHKIIPIYIVDDANAGEWRLGGASRVWLHHALDDLNQQLEGKLSLFAGKADEILPQLVEQASARAVFWNRCYEPWRIDQDERIKAALKHSGVEAHNFNGSLLWEPWQVLKDDGTPYKVFTPYYRNGCLAGPQPRMTMPAPVFEFAEFDTDGAVDLTALKLLPRIKWYESIEAAWDISAKGAKQTLVKFLEDGLHGYKKGRDFPAQQKVSRLSPYLHFGMLSPHQVWHIARMKHSGGNHENDLDHFLSELGWREFSHSLLYHFPELPLKNLQSKFNDFPWRDDPKPLKAWQQGKTGYPIVDAGMRELWQTGYMHNRVRMIVASFLVKNLLTHWHEGEKWFWDCLVDADLANNSASWQWVAGSGADAAPYFRIFNPVTQSEKFDADGEYVRQYVPEIARLPDKFLHKPWTAPDDILKTAGIELGETYPEPIVDLKASRKRALQAFKSLSV